jgi:hypothetical protein
VPCKRFERNRLRNNVGPLLSSRYEKKAAVSFSVEVDYAFVTNSDMWQWPFPVA